MIRISEKRLNQIISESIMDVIDKEKLMQMNDKPRQYVGGNVQNFTPHPKGNAERVWKDILSGRAGTPEERNPSYARAKREAEERRRQKELQRQQNNM